MLKNHWNTDLYMQVNDIFGDKLSTVTISGQTFQYE